MAQPPFIVVVWGDSIAAGNQQCNWPAMAEFTHNLVLNTGRTLRVINSGIGGKPAAHARKEFADRVLSHQPALVVIQFGFNDIRMDGTRGATPLSTPAEFEEHMCSMIEACLVEAGAAVAVFGNHRTRVNLRFGDGRMYDQWREIYNRRARRAAKVKGVPFYDMSICLKLPGAKWYDFVAEDGVHLSELGTHAYARFAAGDVFAPAVRAAQQQA